MPEIKTDDVGRAVRDLFYIAVGFGVIVVQRLNTQREELSQRLDTTFGESRTQFEKAQSDLEDRLKALEERVDALLDEVEGRLPDQAGELMKQSRAVARDARDRLGSIVGRPTSEAA